MQPHLRISLLISLAAAPHGALAAGPGEAATRALADEVKSNGWIVFSAKTAAGDWDLFAMRPDGGSLANLTNTPSFSEITPLLSADGKRLLYRRLAKSETVDGNRFGAQGALVVATPAKPVADPFGKEGEFPWACFSPDATQIATLAPEGVAIVDLASRKTVRTLDRHGLFQQLTWSPDGKNFAGVTNGFGASWMVGRLTAAAKANAVSEQDCCTPDWFPDGKRLLYSNRGIKQKSNSGYGWTQLWSADPDGGNRTLVYAEENRHIYGGHVSPDGKYVLFTGNLQEDGDPSHAGSPMSLIRLSDTPMIVGAHPETRAKFPKAAAGPVLSLPAGFEPVWTRHDLFAHTAARPASSTAATSATAPSTAPAADVARAKGWIAFSAKTDAGDWDIFAVRPDGTARHVLVGGPDTHEMAPRFSADGRKLLFYRAPKSDALDNNTYGKNELVIADADGSNQVSLGKTEWASWGAGHSQIACLTGEGIQIVDVATRKAVRTLARHGFVEQLTWSPDGRNFIATANNLGAYWNIGLIAAASGGGGKPIALSETDRYNCTADFFPDGNRVVYSRGIIPDKGGFARLYSATLDGKQRMVLFAEDNRHLYGGCVSPDGQFLLFTRGEGDLGAVEQAKTRVAIIPLPAAPTIAPNSPKAASDYPNAKVVAPVDLGPGWEPTWTSADLSAKSPATIPAKERR